MPRPRQEIVLCQMCQQPKRLSEVLPGELVRAPIVEAIRRVHPDWASSGYICLADLNHFRTQYVQDALEEEKGELSSLEQGVLKSLKEHELLSKNLNVEFERELTVGERVADRVAEFGGSWRFMISFGAVLVAWLAVNSFTVIWRPFDPYPYILLNLVLSCLAAIQAPIIMMSQNRQEAKDRMRAEHDYRVNLKAELEIRHLNGKMDLLMTRQWHRLMEIQEIQTELLEEFTRKLPHGPGR